MTSGGLKPRDLKLRDRFAGEALQALIAAAAGDPNTTPEIIAHEAYRYASAMMTARACWGGDSRRLCEEMSK
jgi:hypothetical protein